MQSFENSNGKSIVEAMITVIQENKTYLAEVDGLIGDGDHGMNMNKGFTICESRMQGRDISFDEALDELGTILFSEIGGSMGPIYGTIFMEMAESIKGKSQIDAPAFLAMLEAAITGLETIIEAKVGDKTLMDTLIPACDSFKAALDAGDDFSTALTKMEKAAEAGKDSTVDLVAKFGRSSRLGERSRGVLDAGATSCFIILKAMAGAIHQLIS